MKVIFLDFDGVIVTAHTRYHSGDPFCVHLLNDIIKKTGAKIVVSSSWRINTSVDKLREELVGWGVKGEVIDKTPFLPDGRRGTEIAQWLKAHPEVTEFVILDDDSDMVYLMHKLVKTHAIHGLDEHHVTRAVQMLGALNDSGSGPTNNQEAQTSEPAPVQNSGNQD